MGPSCGLTAPHGACRKKRLLIILRGQKGKERILVMRNVHIAHFIPYNGGFVQHLRKERHGGRKTELKRGGDRKAEEWPEGMVGKGRDYAVFSPAV